MRISVIGCGYLGAVHAAGLASLGHDVIGIDADPEKAALLSAGLPTFYEPGLPELLDESLTSGRLRFDTDLAAIQGSTVHFICVGTPQMPDGLGADLGQVEGVVTALLPHLAPGDLVVGKSTVPVGTAARLQKMIKDAAPGAELAWNPEFLREGFAVQDTLHPDRLVYGVSDESRESSVATLNLVYAQAVQDETPVIVSDFATAEMVKVAANSFLATKISFINAMAEICEATGADVTLLADAIGHDDRIGRKFLNAGLGFGGGCLPKDIRAFMARAEELGVDQALTFLAEVDAINSRRRDRVVEMTLEMCGGSVVGRRLAILGAAFKPNSDDVRDAPSLHVADLLQAAGGHVVVTDPRAGDNARKAWPGLDVVDTVDEAVRDADVVLVLTEWEEYRQLDPGALGRSVRQRHVIDGRLVLDADHWRTAGWTYRALGRPSLAGV